MSGTTAAFVIIAVNVIFFLGGGSLVAVGALEKTHHLDFLGRLNTTSIHLTPEEEFRFNAFVSYAPLTLITIGAVVATLALAGCCGACYRSRSLLFIYFAVLLVVFLVQVALSIWAGVSMDTFEQQGVQAMKNTYADDANIFNLVCPDSCSTSDSTPSDSCIDCVKSDIAKYNTIFVGIVAGTALLELILLVMSCVLISHVQRRRHMQTEMFEQNYIANKGVHPYYRA